MRAYSFSLFVLLLSISFGCNQRPLNGSYGIAYNADDSLRVEMVFKQVEGRKSFIIPESTVPSTVRGDQIYTFHHTSEPDPDMYLNLIPSALFDSLFVYGIVDGQSELRYSGVNDADWRINVSRKYRQYHTLTLP